MHSLLIVIHPCAPCDGAQLPYSNSKVPPQFDPPCNEDPEAWRTESGLCSGRFPVNVSIVDWLHVPRTTPPGEWVLQFRYDCEETAQIWSHCADITVAAA